jgi:signal transduction histidine kinase
MLEKQGDFHGRLVRLEAQLVDVQVLNWGARIFLKPDGQRYVGAVIMVEDVARVKDIRPGSRVALTGVLEVLHQDKPGVQDRLRISSFQILLRGMEDVTVVSLAPWWTTQRLLWLSLGALALLAAAAFWILLLRRLLAWKSAQLESALKHHRDAELEHDAAQRERMRLASDLHDGFQQLLAGSVYRLNAAARKLPAAPEEAAEHIASARQTMAHTQEAFRNALWGLTEVAEGPPDFPRLLEQATRRMDHWEDRVRIHVSGEPRPFSRHLMGSLLLLFQEAVGNAFRHGMASLVKVEVSYDENDLTMVIADDGSGFDAALLPEGSGHYGVQSMRDRMRWLGGTFSLESQLGKGTYVTASISWEKAAALENPPPWGTYKNKPELTQPP